ncbi:MAG TPA: glycosyltransferase, partial [Gemmatimonadaceae bacterium]|nr:glycosyltransferase [Gemmatimonadaceae bacterium]
VGAAACYIAPLRVGGGTRLKLLDAWAMGKAIVSTSIGAEGLGARNEENMLLADTADAFAAAVTRVLSDDALRRRLGAAARQTAVRQFSWTVIADQVHDLYAHVVADGSAG